MPLARGQLRVPAIWVAAPDGHAVPAQAHVLEHWPDGSIRWLLVDFLADVAGGASATYTLRTGTPPRPAAGARLALETHGAMRVVTAGPLHVTVSGAPGTLAELASGGLTVALPLPTLTVDGAKAGPPSPGSIAVETEGPVRTELLLRGRYAAGLTYETRLAVFAGQPFVRVQHTIIDTTDAPYAPVRSLAVPLAGRFTSGALGIDGGPHALAALDGAHTLRQPEAHLALLDGERVGRHGDGWARASGEAGSVTVVARWFWEEYPKALEVGPERVRLDLVAGTDEPVQLGRGAAKTLEFWVAVEPAAASRPGTLASALTAPLATVPPAGAIVASGALPEALAPDAPGARDFLSRLAAAYEKYQKRVRAERWDDGPPVACTARAAERPRVGFYGLLNWGDWNFPGYRDHSEGCDGWGNLEYDLPQVLGLAYAATESRLFWNGLVPAARHYRDVDVIHHAPGHPDWVGLNHPHKAGHFAPESPSTVDLGHTWTEGLLTYWRLTGETRALAAARGIADALVSRVAKARNPRQFGWPMVALTAVGDATGERRYVDAARVYATAGIAAHRPTPAAGDWKMGILADGLAAVHAATGDAQIRRWLVAYADALVAEPTRFADPRYALPLGYLAALTGDPRYRSAALDVVHTMRIGDWGKPFAVAGRAGFRLLAPLAVTPARGALPPASRHAPRPPSPSPAAPRPRGAD